MGPDPTRAYFWPAVNKKPTRLWPECYLTQNAKGFFDPKCKIFEKFGITGEIFHTQTKDG